MGTRTYESGDLQVLWDSHRCVHVAQCIQALPAVFNPLERPWVRMANGSTSAIIAAVEGCPTGALRYVRKDGVPEVAPAETTIVPVPDGPLLVRGDLRVLAPDGTTVIRETRLTFCRCGASENKPFCDNSHRRIGFHTNDAAPEFNEAVESPSEIAPRQEQAFR